MFCYRSIDKGVRVVTALGVVSLARVSAREVAGVQAVVAKGLKIDQSSITRCSSRSPKLIHRPVTTGVYSEIYIAGY